jgi:hypothetical protein
MASRRCLGHLIDSSKKSVAAATDTFSVSNISEVQTRKHAQLRRQLLCDRRAKTANPVW